MITKIHLISDTHLEFCPDGGQSFFDSIDSKDIDVLVIAGDFCQYTHFKNTLEKGLLALKARYPEVLYIMGNHELYYGNPAKTSGVERICAKTGVRLLDNKVFCMNGLKFIGGTMWFRDNPMNVCYEQWFPDFMYIQRFKPWVYKQQAKFDQLLQKELDNKSVVITHHIPLEALTQPEYAGSEFNRFFVCDQENLILDRSPKAWLFGHTHKATSKQINDTLLVCNPMGFRSEGSSKYSPLLIEVDNGQ